MASKEKAAESKGSREKRAKSSVASINLPAYDELIAVLREAREDKGVPREALSKMLGHDLSFTYRLETKHRRVDVVEFCQIADALQIDPRQMFDMYLRRLGK